MWKHTGAVLAAVFAAALIGAAVAFGMRLGEASPGTASSPAPGSISASPSALPIASPGQVLLKTPETDYSGTRPTTIGFSGDGGNIVVRIHWANWGSKSATGYGIIGLNNCNPDCASGEVTYQDVTITLSDPTGSPLVWGRMTEAISGQPALQWTYPHHWALDAT